MRAAAFLSIAIVLAACGDTGQARVRYPLVAESDATSFVTPSGWSVALTEARLGVGPIYFCASEQASAELCPVAVDELAATVEVDLVAVAAAVEAPLLGEVSGTDGTIRSVALDYGVTWFTTQRQATPQAAAPDGVSAVLAGTATKEARTLAFRARVVVAPQFAGASSVAYRTDGVVTRASSRATARFVPARLFDDLDFEALAAATPDGTTATLEPTSTAALSITSRLQTAAAPTFSWR
jgi:hypothetical protein